MKNIRIIDDKYIYWNIIHLVILALLDKLDTDNGSLYN